MQTERDLPVMVQTVYRILADAVQRVVSPSHVPLIAEAEPAPVDGSRHHWPGGGFLGRRGPVGKTREELRINVPQKRDGVQIFTATMLVRNPAPLRTAVVEVKHRGHSIDTQAIDCIAVKPEQPAG